MRDERVEAKREAESLDEPAAEARALAERLGLAPYPVRYWVVDHDKMNELIAYGGFQRRYPHWRWGMNYERQRKKDRHGLGKAFEIVNNDDPSHAFLQESNSAADQKAVITHVEAHADFFANNRWFGLYADRGEDGPNAAARLERNADRISAIADRPEADRDEVERLIDAVSALEDTIDQHSPVDAARSVDEPGVSDDVTDLDDDAVAAIEDRIAELDLSEEVRRDVFDDEWLEARGEGVEPEEPRPDVLAFLRDHGKRYDPDSGKAVDREPWETTVIDALREEAYYFAGQKQTKVLNEGWATYWESVMMGGEGFAGPDEFLTYADHMSRVLGSPGLNPYKLGFELWTHVELRAARGDVIDKLLRVEGVTPENFHSRIDLDEVAAALEPHPAIAGAGPATLDELGDLAADGDPRVDAEAVDRALSARDGERPQADGDGEADPDAGPDVERYPWKLLTREGLAERHYVLSRPEHRGALRNVSRETLAERALAWFQGWDEAREQGSRLNSGAPVMVLPRVFTPEFCDRLIGLWQQEHHEGGLSDANRNVQDTSKKKTLEHVIQDQELIQTIAQTLHRRIGPELRKAFMYAEPYAFESFIVMSYKPERKDFFGSHRDRYEPNHPRRFAVSLNLNDGFEGGELCFPEYGPHLYQPTKGGAAVFSCSLLHEALPVRSGQRFVMTAFFNVAQQKQPGAG